MYTNTSDGGKRRRLDAERQNRAPAAELPASPERAGAFGGSRSRATSPEPARTGSLPFRVEGRPASPVAPAAPETAAAQHRDSFGSGQKMAQYVKGYFERQNRGQAIQAGLEAPGLGLVMGRSAVSLPRLPPRESFEGAAVRPRAATFPLTLRDMSPEPTCTPEDSLLVGTASLPRSLAPAAEEGPGRPPSPATEEAAAQLLGLHLQPQSQSLARLAPSQRRSMSLGKPLPWTGRQRTPEG